ncbi:MAG: hypothetical protein U1C57_02905, partial [Candidatus Doudnabacteria bacterium]|nr:hypothetical protein [Candidatus Doudnabacteria bacterium]
AVTRIEYMAELTKKYFDKQIGALVTKTSLEEVLETKFEEQAVLINKAFQDQKEHFDELLAGMDLKIDKIDERLQTVETKLDRALYTELTHLEGRLRRVEEKVGLKPAS